MLPTITPGLCVAIGAVGATASWLLFFVLLHKILGVRS
jgi:hypothetical protein